jgi:hypothetical protein
MLSRFRRYTASPVLPVTLVLLALALVWVSPREATLGDGIKTVYVHVALTWTGLLGFVAAAALGLVTLIAPRPRRERWARRAGRAGLLFYAAGFVMSMVSSIVNWGGIPLYEPRNIVAVQTLAVAVVMQVFHGSRAPARLKALLDAAFCVYLLWSIGASPLILHPRDPIGSSSSVGIQLTFLGMFVLATLAAAWLAPRLAPAPPTVEPPASAYADVAD